MLRGMYHSKLRHGAEEAFRDAIARDGERLRASYEEQGGLTVSVFLADAEVCVYAEAKGETVAWSWPDSYRSMLEEWPGAAGNRLATPLLDIFHDGVPADPVSWRGGRRVDKRAGSMARLKPEMAASYIFYHYQLQEEHPEGFNKTYTIGANGTFLFSYSEYPAAVSEVKPRRSLSTNNTPLAQWHEVMLPHFDPWPGYPEEERLWRPMERIFGFGGDGDEA